MQHHDPLYLHVYTTHGRFYKVGEYGYPGVGTILSATESPEQQEFWSQWRGSPGNAAYSEQAKNRGKLFHTMVERHFKSTSLDNSPATSSEAIAQPFWESVQDVLSRITNPVLIESACWHEIGCYAGTVDLVAGFDEQPVILDWKTATKPKKPEWLARYPLQLTAYCGAINLMYGTRIRKGVIVVPLPKQSAQVFEFDLGKYWRPWLSRLVAYWEQQDIPLAAQALSSIRREYSS